MNNKIYNFTTKQRKRDLRFYKMPYDSRGAGIPLSFLKDDWEWQQSSHWWYASDVPAWFKRLKNRKYRAICKGLLRNQAKYIDYDFVYPLSVHDASWYYF